MNYARIANAHQSNTAPEGAHLAIIYAKVLLALGAQTLF